MRLILVAVSSLFGSCDNIFKKRKVVLDKSTSVGRLPKHPYKVWVDRNPLRAWRLSQQPRQTLMSVATACGASFTTIMLWENGSTTPGPERMEAIAAVMGKPVLELAKEWLEWRKSRPGFSDIA